MAEPQNPDIAPPVARISETQAAGSEIAPSANSEWDGQSERNNVNHKRERLNFLANPKKGAPFGFDLKRGALSEIGIVCVRVN